MQDNSDKNNKQPFLTLRQQRHSYSSSSSSSSASTETTLVSEIPIYFQEDWQHGIGGGLWSTGLAMTRYFLQHPHALQQLQQKQHHMIWQPSSSSSTTTTAPIKSILELGSGNGLLSVCLWALKCANLVPSIADIVVTDATLEHLEMIQKTITANTHLSSCASSECNIHVMEHVWGVFDTQSDQSTLNATNNNNNNYNHNNRDSITEKTKHGQFQYDLIVGSDLAYRKELYDPLILSLLQFSHDHTTILLGVTMVDTTPLFFDKLTAAGFVYQRFADHLMEPEYRGKTFGIFAITRRK